MSISTAGSAKLRLLALFTNRVLGGDWISASTRVLGYE